MPRKTPLGVRIVRSVPTKLYPFSKFFRGFENVPAIRQLFGARTREVLRRQKVEFFSSRFGYMGTSDEDGHLIISTHHLRTSPLTTLYLDFVHELRHVKQFRDGRPLFYPKVSYVDAPSEIEAYRFTVDEGRRLGLSDRQLVDYLKVEWISPAEHRRLARHCGVQWAARPASARRRRLRR